MKFLVSPALFIRYAFRPCACMMVYVEVVPVFNLDPEEGRDFGVKDYQVRISGPQRLTSRWMCETLHKTREEASSMYAYTTVKRVL